MIRGAIKKIGEIFLRDKGKKYIIVEGDKNLINPDYEISVDDLGGGGNNGGNDDGSSEEEYSTDYPEDFTAILIKGTEVSFPVSIDSYIGGHTFNGVKLDLSNIDLDSIKINAEIVTPLFDSNRYNNELPDNYPIIKGSIRNSELLIYTNINLKRNIADDVFETFKVTVFFKFKNLKSNYKLTICNWRYTDYHLSNVFCKIDDSVFINQVKTFTYAIKDILI